MNDTTVSAIAPAAQDQAADLVAAENLYGPPPDPEADRLTDEWAGRYREHGVAIAQIESGGKRPVYAEWNLRSIEPAELRPGCNLGILTGTLSGDLVCVDLDAPEAVRRADEFLPATGMVEGRPGKPRSHRYFKVNNIPVDLIANPQSISGGQLGGPRTVRFSVRKTADDGSDKSICLVEVLGTGRHVTAPPSLHESGERREWHEFGEPALVDCRELYDAVERLATACGYLPTAKSTAATAAAGEAGGGPRRLAAPGERVYLPGLPPIEDRIVRARAYLAQVDPAVSGEGGHNATFRAACVVVRDFAVDPEEARTLLIEYNERCDPPWSAAELQQKLADADDFNGDRGSKLGSAATMPAAPPPPESADDPHRLARRFLEQAGSVDGLPSWRYWRDEFWRWSSTHYMPSAKKDFRAQLTGAIRKELEAQQQREEQEQLAAHQQKRGGTSPTPGTPPPSPPKPATVRRVTTNLVNDTELARTALTRLPFAIDQPAWLTDDGAESRSCLALANSLLDLEAYQAGPVSLVPHTPRWFSRISLPYAWEPAATCLQWLAALDLIFAGDAQRIAVLQEWFGYCLTRSTDEQKFLMPVVC